MCRTLRRANGPLRPSPAYCVSVKTFYRLVGVVVLAAVAFVALGPLLPAGNPIGDAADTFMRALRAFWGVPITQVSP